ncbi:hypothetical protein PPERSA_11372 [Pseudocohnilembus persalinus]|uniref:Uncharacterized protein n=1 Tax=Pseudocohnilembus persalinus TaxID=266149 RepID=A0A0V0QQF2_PSEPJ|nr:hypothetical protein PPERSA_11372 [Pseudocohnilembus persalinus]|eukprot:KRX04248.1 hypothetical protein PPERSA_11372 [Pseudocohnilembus persalinus]
MGEKGTILFKQFIQQNIGLKNVSLYFDLLTLSKFGAKQLHDFFTNLESIEILKIHFGSQNNLNEENLTPLFKSISTKVLKELYIKVGSMNKCQSISIDAIGQVLQNNGKTLEKLRLQIGSFNDINSDNLNNFYQSFKYLEKLKYLNFTLQKPVSNHFLMAMMNVYSESDSVEQIAIQLQPHLKQKNHYITRLFQKIIMNKKLIQSQLIVEGQFNILYQIEQECSWKKKLEIQLQQQDEIKQKLAQSVYNLIKERSQELYSLKITDIDKIKLPALNTIAQAIFELPNLFSCTFKRGDIHNQFGQQIGNNDPIINTRMDQLNSLIKKYINDRVKVFKNFLNLYQKHMVKDHKDWEKALPLIAEKMKLMVPFNREELLQQQQQIRYKSMDEQKQGFKPMQDQSLDNLAEQNLILDHMSEDFF